MTRGQADILCLARCCLLGLALSFLAACATGPAEATCKVGMWVEVDGTITDPEIVQSTGFPRLDEACLKGVRGQKLTPGTANGVPVRMHTILPITWRLHDGPPPPGVFMNGPTPPMRTN